MTTGKNIFVIAYVESFTFIREVDYEEGENKARELKAIFMETSARSGNNVKQLFKKIALSLPGNELSSDEAANVPCNFNVQSRVSVLTLFKLDTEVTLQGATNAEQKANGPSKCAC